jgi:hypothetical protein
MYYRIKELYINLVIETSLPHCVSVLLINNYKPLTQFVVVILQRRVSTLKGHHRAKYNKLALTVYTY